MTPWGRVERRHFVAVGLLALAIGIIAVIQGTANIVAPPKDSDLLAFFLPAAGRVVDGHPFDIYAVRAFGDYPNYNPPVSIELMAPIVGVARALDLPGVKACIAASYGSLDCRALVSIVGFGFMPFILLLGVAALAAIRRAAASVAPEARLVAFGLIVLSPLLWLDFTDWWHFEQPLMLFLLVVGVWLLQSGRTIPAGVILALAVLTRTTAVVPLVALGAVLLAERRWETLWRLVATVAVVGLVVLVPFFIADPSNAAYSLLTWRGTAPIGNSIWSVLSGTPLASIARSADQPVALAFALVAGWLGVRRLGVSAGDRSLWGVLAVAALAVPLLSKTSWPYYYAEPFVLLVIWEAATGADAREDLWRRPVVSMLFLAAAATLGQFMGTHSVTNGGIVLRLMGLLQFVVVGAFALVAWRRMREVRQHPRPLVPTGS